MVEEEFGPLFQAAGCEVIFGDNNKKLHSVVTTNLFLSPIDFGDVPMTLEGNDLHNISVDETYLVICWLAVWKNGID